LCCACLLSSWWFWNRRISMLRCVLCYRFYGNLSLLKWSAWWAVCRLWLYTTEFSISETTDKNRPSYLQCASCRVRGLWGWTRRATVYTPPAYVFFGSLGVGVTCLLPSVGLNHSVVLGPVPCQRTPLPLSVVLAFGLQTAKLPRPPIAAIQQLPTGYLSECFERRDLGVQITYIHIATVNYTHTYRLAYMRSVATGGTAYGWMSEQFLYGT